MKRLKKLNKKYSRLKLQFLEWFKDSNIYSNFTFNYFYKHIYLSTFTQTIINYPRYTIRYNKFYIWMVKILKSKWLIRKDMQRRYWRPLFTFLFSLFCLIYYKSIALFLLFYLIDIMLNTYRLRFISDDAKNRFEFFQSKRRFRRQKLLLNTSLRRKFILRKLKGHFYRTEVPLNYKRHEWRLCKVDFKEFVFDPSECQNSINFFRHESPYIITKPLDFRSDTLFQQNRLKNYILSQKLLIKIITKRLIKENFIRPDLLRNSIQPPDVNIVIRQVYAKYFVYDYGCARAIIFSCFAICWQDSKQCIPIIALGPWCSYRAQISPIFEFLPNDLYKAAWNAPYHKKIPLHRIIYEYREEIKLFWIYNFLETIFIWFLWIFDYAIVWLFFFIEFFVVVIYLYLDFYYWFKQKRKHFNALLYYYYYAPARYLYRSIWRKSLKKRKIPWFTPKSRYRNPFDYNRYGFKAFFTNIKDLLDLVVNQILQQSIMGLIEFIRRRTWLMYIFGKISKFYKKYWPIEWTPEYQFLYFFDIQWALLVNDWNFHTGISKILEWEYRYQDRWRDRFVEIFYASDRFYKRKKKQLGTGLLHEVFFTQKHLYRIKRKYLKRLSSWIYLWKHRIVTSIWFRSVVNYKNTELPVKIYSYFYVFFYYFCLLLIKIFGIIPKIIYFILFQIKYFVLQILTLNTKKNDFYKYIPEKVNYWKYHIVSLQQKVLNIFYKTYGKEKIPTSSLVHYNILSRRITNPVIQLFKNYKFTTIHDEIFRLLRLERHIFRYQPFWTKKFNLRQYFTFLFNVQDLSSFSLDKKLIVLNDPLFEENLKLIEVLPHQLDILPNNFIFAEYPEFFNQHVLLFHHANKKKKLIWTSNYGFLPLFDEVSFLSDQPFAFYSNFPLISQNQISFSIALPYGIGAITSLYNHNSGTNLIELMRNDLRTNDIIWRNIVSNRILDELGVMINLLKLNIKDSCQNIYNIFNKKSNKTKIIVGSHKKNTKKKFRLKSKYEFTKLFEHCCDNLLLSTFEIYGLNSNNT